MFGGSCRRGTSRMFLEVSRSTFAAVLGPYTRHSVTVFMNYDRFRPTGTAYLSLSSQSSVTRNLRILNSATMSSLTLQAKAVPSPFSVARTRGSVGRQEAANKGLIDGNGPNGGTSGNGKNIIMWGLPGKLPPDGLRNYLRAFRLSDEGGQESIVKIEP
jgi:hypothetical protein